MCTFVYGMNDRQCREELWRDMKSCDVFEKAQIILGEFNVLMHMGDRIGHSVREREIVDGMYGLVQNDRGEDKWSI